MSQMNADESGSFSSALIRGSIFRFFLRAFASFALSRSQSKRYGFHEIIKEPLR
jgi:hypothetical protein